MNEQLGEAVLKLALDGSGFKVGANGVSGSLNDIIKKTGQAALGFTGGLGLYNAIEKVRTSLINNVADFRTYERSLKEVSTLVDTTVVDMGALEVGIDKVSKKWARGKDSLTSALYETISANVAAGDAVAFLDEAVEGSIGGVTSATVAVDGLTSVMNAYGLTVKEVSDVNDAFFVAVRDGKLKYEDLANYIGKVVPVASQLKMGYVDLVSAVAAQTQMGVKPETAFTGLMGILKAILKPTEAAKETAKLLGIEFDATAFKIKGFTKFMEEIKEKTSGSETALARLFNDIEALNSAMNLTSERGAKNFNKVLDDQKVRFEESARAADKMKDSLDFDMEMLGNNWKNLGLGIVGGLKPAIEYVTESFNGLFDLGRKVLGFDPSLLKQFKTNPNEMPKEDLDSIVAYQKANIEYQQMLSKKTNAELLVQRIEPATFRTRVKNEIKESEELIAKIQEIIDIRKIEAGEADKALSYQKYRQKEKDDIDKKAAEKRQKEVDDLIKNQEQIKKNQEIAQKNADLLNKLESDRLAVAERISGIEGDRYSQQLEDKKRAVEAIAKYNKITYDAQKDDLQKIVDDENKSTEERIAANNKLFTVKNEAAMSARNSEKQALELLTELEIAEQKKRVEAIKAYMKEIDIQYNNSKEKINNSDLNKDKKLAQLNDLETTHTAQKKSLQFMVGNSDQAFGQIESRGKMAAKNIDEEFKATVGGENYRAKVTTEVDLQLKDLFNGDSSSADSIFNGILTQYDKLKDAVSSGNFAGETKREIERELKKVQVSIGVEVASVAKKSMETSLDVLTNVVGMKAEDVAVEVGDIVSSIGDATENGYIKAAGEVIGFFGQISGAINDKYDKEYRNTLKQIELAEKLNEGTEKTINKTRDWLIQIGEVDTSNMSLSELKTQQKSILTKGAGDLNSILGIDQYSDQALTSDDIKNLVDIVGSNEEAVSWIKKFRSDWGLTVNAEQAGNIKSLASGKSYDEFQKAIEDEGIKLTKEYGNNTAWDMLVKKYGIEPLDIGANGKISKENYQQFQALSNEQIATLFKVANSASTNGLDIGAYSSNITDIAKQYSEPLKTTQGYISNYGSQTGIDPTQSKTKEDLLADLQTMLDLGTVSELEYYKQLYEYATGKRIAGVNNSAEWFSESEWKTYKKKYEDIQNQGSSGIIGLAEGGIVMGNGELGSLFRLGDKNKTEAVIPLEQLGSIMNSTYGGMGGGTINVNLTVDPNIPITRDSAAMLSEQFGQRIETVFRSRGI